MQSILLCNLFTTTRKSILLTFCNFCCTIFFNWRCTTVCTGCLHSFLRSTLDLALCFAILLYNLFATTRQYILQFLLYYILQFMLQKSLHKILHGFLPYILYYVLLFFFFAIHSQPHVRASPFHFTIGGGRGARVVWAFWNLYSLLQFLVKLAPWVANSDGTFQRKGDGEYMCDTRLHES